MAACISGIFPIEGGLKWMAQRELMLRDLDRSASIQAVFAAEDQVMARLFERAAAQKPKLPMVFDRALDAKDAEDVFAAMEHPPELQTGFEGLKNLGCQTCIEIGLPGSVSRRASWVKQDDGYLWVKGLDMSECDWKVLLEGLQALYYQGFPIQWMGVDQPYGQHVGTLPTYPFSQQRFWLSPLEEGLSQVLPDVLRMGDRPTHFSAYSTETDIDSSATALLKQLQSLEIGDRRVTLTQYLQQQIAKILNLDSPEHIEPRQRFFDMGLDSLIALELKHSLEHNLSSPLPATVLFDYPTLEALVEYLLAGLNGTDRSSLPLPTSTPLPMVQIKPLEIMSAKLIADLSDTEAEALLLRELASLNY